MLLLIDYLNAIALVLAIPIVVGDNVSERRDLKFLDLAKYDGYTADQHYVTTEDGYNLGVFRIPPKENCTDKKGPIVFMHGLYLSGDDCLVPGPGKAHCYIYADNCYDVWVPNVRGNLYSRNHTSKNPDTSEDFWDFSVDEMAMFDLPAVIDYVLNATNNINLSFVGHSQGYTMLLILCSKKPEYNAKIKVGFGISATAWLDHAKFIVIQLQGLISPILTNSGKALNKEVLTRNGLTNTVARLLCGTPNVNYQLCSSFIFAVLGYNKYQITSDVLPVVVGHIPSGTSLKNFNRWGQMKQNGFSEYDYGTIKNLLIYGSSKPPLYNLANVSMKTVIIGSNNDYVANITDVQLLVSKLSNVSLCTLSDNTFGHLDFIYGKDIPNYITPIIMSTIETGSYNCM